MSNWSCSHQPMPLQHGIQATAVTYTTAHCNARSLTHWTRPGSESATSWFLVGFVFTAPWWELLGEFLWALFCYICFRNTSSQIPSLPIGTKLWISRKPVALWYHFSVRVKKNCNSPYFFFNVWRGLHSFYISAFLSGHQHIPLSREQTSDILASTEVV